MTVNAQNVIRTPRGHFATPNDWGSQRKSFWSSEEFQASMTSISAEHVRRHALINLPCVLISLSNPFAKTCAAIHRHVIKVILDFSLNPAGAIAKGRLQNQIRLWADSAMQAGMATSRRVHIRFNLVRPLYIRAVLPADLRPLVNGRKKVWSSPQILRMAM
jgi:hypothetical protein